MYAYREFQSGIDMLAFLNNYTGAGSPVPLPQASILALGFDPGNGRYFVFFVAA